MARAIIVVDVQNDFCPGGALPVAGGDAVASRITELLASERSRYDLIVATMDWHPGPDEEPGFTHFSSHPDWVTSWPSHCVRGTVGAQLQANLVLPEGAIVVRKGQAGAAYSGFEGHDDDGTPLAEIVRQHDIDSADVVGLATDYCVRATALDACSLGLSVRVLRPLCAGVAPDSTDAAIAELRAAGVTIVP